MRKIIITILVACGIPGQVLAQSYEQIYLLAPVEGSVLNNPYPIFNWSLTGCSGILQLHIVEVKQQPNGTFEPVQSSVLANPAHYRATVTGNFVHIYPITAPKLVGGRRYAWHITCTGTEEGNLNFSSSEVFYFDVALSSVQNDENNDTEMEGIFYHPNNNTAIVRTLKDDRFFPVALSTTNTQLSLFILFNSKNEKISDYTYKQVSPKRLVFDMRHLPSQETYNLKLQYIDGIVDLYQFIK